jgi:hypothetical protein
MGKIRLHFIDSDLLYMYIDVPFKAIWLYVYMCYGV